MKLLYRVEIVWNEDIDSYMTHARSKDSVLEKFFSINDWAFIKQMFPCVVDEKSLTYEEKEMLFEEDDVLLSVNNKQTSLDKSEFLLLIQHLFDILIVGANNDHHSVRYEPWWYEFTESAYQLKRTIDLFN